MRYLAAYLLVTLGGKANPTAEDIEKVLSSVGIDSDKKKVQLVLEKLKGKNIEATIAEGNFSSFNLFISPISWLIL